MSSIRIPHVIDRLPRTPEGGGPKAPKVPGMKDPVGLGLDPRFAEVSDDFRSQPSPAPHPSVGGQERPPVKSVAELVPPQLRDTPGQEALGHRFASDAALLASHLTPPQLPGSERATRLWAFYTAYATAAAQHPPEPEAQTAFREALEGQGFAELRDAHTGEDGVARGLWVLEARTPEEARTRAASVQLEPPPEVRHSEEAAARPAAEPLLAQASMARHPAAPHAPLTPAFRPHEDTPRPEEAEGRRSRGTNRRLGAAMLWNVLHRFRSEPEEGAVAEGQWDRLTFGALLALLGIALAVAALVSL
ncbi:Immediate early protein ICP0 [Comamonas sp. JC664]|uniref:Immediate early protein ICP0 n=1 Tax=Comamonas sp. JC664 TaxID=2801917 RepID=UPI00174A4245|nr:Immediate early protein ICP0 [Comamonas sp. JC664]MBL0698487.1 hypothetical protein [Comamonas sp. JC664]GHH00120.1 hypothetical protein GCM10012319_66910 [Comamonas sp. KCTC 72670]